MIPVRAVEHVRELTVRVGDKMVGRIFVYNTGNITAWVRNPAGTERDWKWIEGGLKSIKSATNVVLRAQGYGNCRSVDVERVGRLP